MRIIAGLSFRQPDQFVTTIGFFSVRICRNRAFSHARL